MNSRARLTVVVMVVLAALLVGAGLALGLTPKTGSYVGQSAQGELVRLKVTNNGKRVSGFRTKAVVRCPGGRYYIPVFLPWSERITPRGRFTYYAYNDVASIRIVGKFVTERRVRGTFRARFNDGTESCESGVVRWRAHA